MASETPHYGFTTLDQSTDTLDYRDHKFTAADRVLLDKLLAQFEHHHHSGTGAAAASEAPPPAPLANGTPIGGNLAANTAAYYRSALVDETGREHVASQTAVVYTPAPVFPPDPPSLAYEAGGGLMVGPYRYALSAYTQDTNQETVVSGSTSFQLTGSGAIVVTFPQRPSGATGFNVYRQGPTDSILRFLASVEDDDWFYDDGTTTADGLRGVPTANTTSSTNSVTVTPATPPAGNQSWKLYRTFDPFNWDSRLLAWTTDPSVTDAGQATGPGSPLSTSTAGATPTKIDLGTETTGRAPAQIVSTAQVVNFAYRGPVAEGTAPWQWINDFDRARVQSFRASLGRDATPATQPVQVALERRLPGSSVWRRLQVAGDDIVATIPVGQAVGAPVAVPDYMASYLHAGYALRPAIVQTGGFPSTDTDLVVSVTTAARHGTGPAPTYEGVLSTESAATFPSAGAFQRSKAWTATSDGTVSLLRLEVQNPGYWQARLRVLFNTETQYESDVLTFASYGTLDVTPTPAVTFLEGDRVQFEVVPEPGMTGQPYEAFRVEAIFNSYINAGATLTLGWNPVGFTGEPLDYTLVGSTPEYNTDLGGALFEIDIPVDVIDGDFCLLVARNRSAVSMDDIGVTYGDGSEPSMLGLTVKRVDDTGPGWNHVLFARCFTFSGTSRTVRVQFAPSGATQADHSIALVAGRGPNFAISQWPAYETGILYAETSGYSTLPGVWIHVVATTTSSTGAPFMPSSGNWLVNDATYPTIGVLGAGVQDIQTVIGWTAEESRTLMALVIQLLEQG